MTELETLRDDLRKFSAARDWEQFHSPKNLAMALSAEAGELLEVFQWLTEEQSRNLEPKAMAAVIECTRQGAHDHRIPRTDNDMHRHGGSLHFEACDPIQLLEQG